MRQGPWEHLIKVISSSVNNEPLRTVHPDMILSRSELSQWLILLNLHFNSGSNRDSIDIMFSQIDLTR